MSFLAKASLLLASITVATAALAGPVTADFDALNTSGGDTPVPGGYLGLNWTNVTAYTATLGFPGFNHGIVSGPNAAYSGGETSGGTGVEAIVGRITGATLFDFLTADLGAGYYDALQFTALGFLGGAQLFSRTVTLDTTGAKEFAFNFTGIDRLDLVAAINAQTADPFACGGFDCTQFTLDDVHLVTTDVPPPPTGVPEPQSLALVIATGLALAVAQHVIRRRSPDGRAVRPSPH